MLFRGQYVVRFRRDVLQLVCENVRAILLRLSSLPSPSTVDYAAVSVRT